MVQEAPGFSQVSWRKRYKETVGKKHRYFSSSHDIRLRTITMGRYASNQANRSFVTFFLLNARLLLSTRLKFYRKRFLTDGHVEEQKKEVLGGPKGFWSCSASIYNRLSSCTNRISGPGSWFYGSDWSICLWLQKRVVGLDVIAMFNLGFV